MSSGRIGKLFVLTILAVFMLMGGAVAGLLLFGKLLGVAIIAGAVAGTIQGGLYWMDNWGGVGTWCRWTLTIFGYVVVFGFLSPNWPFSLRDPALYALAAGISTLGAGCLMLTDDRRPSRLSPRRFLLLQNRELMWMSADRVRDGRPYQPALDGDPVPAESGDRISARERVREEWISTIRRSRSRLSWWTRE